MGLRIRLDGHELKEDEITTVGKAIIKNLSFVETRLKELHRQKLMLTKAKNTHINGLKFEIVRRKTGVDLNSILNENESQ